MCWEMYPGQPMEITRFFFQNFKAFLKFLDFGCLNFVPCKHRCVVSGLLQCATVDMPVWMSCKLAVIGSYSTSYASRRRPLKTNNLHRLHIPRAFINTDGTLLKEKSIAPTSNPVLM